MTSVALSPLPLFCSLPWLHVTITCNYDILSNLAGFRSSEVVMVGTKIRSLYTTSTVAFVGIFFILALTTK